MKMELEFLQNELNRVSYWIRLSDRKSAFLSAYYSALLAVIISYKKNILTIVSTAESCTLNLVILLIFIILISFGLGTFFLFRSVLPRQKNSFTNTSLFYFGSVAKMKLIDYSKQMRKLTKKESKELILEQIYTNSVIADQKMKDVRNSTACLFIIAVSILILSWIKP